MRKLFVMRADYENDETDDWLGLMVVEITDQFLEDMKRWLELTKHCMQSTEAIWHMDFGCEIRTWLAIYDKCQFVAWIENTRLICDCEDRTCFRCLADESEKPVLLPDDCDLTGWDERSCQQVTVFREGAFVISDLPKDEEGWRFCSASLTLADIS
jgi:hypothetical protein